MLLRGGVFAMTGVENSLDATLMYPQLAPLKDAFCRLWGLRVFGRRRIAT